MNLTSPFCIANSVAAARVVTPAFSKMCCTWWPAVFTEMSSAVAISLLVGRARSRRRTSTSRSVSPAGCSGRTGAAAVTGGRQHRLDCVAVEPPRRASARSCLRGLLGGERRAVRARLGHRVVGVGGSEQAGAMRHRGRGQPPVVAAAVEPLVGQAPRWPPPVPAGSSRARIRSCSRCASGPAPTPPRSAAPACPRCAGRPRCAPGRAGARPHQGGASASGSPTARPPPPASAATAAEWPRV